MIAVRIAANTIGTSQLLKPPSLARTSRRSTKSILRLAKMVPEVTLN